MSRVNRRWLLAQRPVGMVEAGDFRFDEAACPEPAEGEVLLRVCWLAFDPAMRGWMEDRESYLPPVGIGEVMRGGGVAEVVASRHPDYAEGELVQGLFGWQEYALMSGPGVQGLSRVPRDIPPTLVLSVLGITGLTAWFGLHDIGRPVSGETVVVSGAAGATGSVAAQLARLSGCRVIGIAGGARKCAWLRDEAGLDDVVDYKAENVEARLRALCPQGIDVYFDNVGGKILDAALARLALRARVVMCGGISGYNEKEPPAGPRNLMNVVIQRARMEGFIVLDYAPRFPEALKELAGHVREGRIAYLEDVQQGIENAPRTFLRLFDGSNFGKQLLELASPGS